MPVERRSTGAPVTGGRCGVRRRHRHDGRVAEPDLLRLVAALVLLVGVAGAVSVAGRLGTARETGVVVARAIVQLLAVAAVIRIVFATPWLAPVYLLSMVGVAAATSSRRLRRRGVPGTYLPAVASITAGALSTLVCVSVTMALPWSARQLVPFAAQVIGGSMTATTLASVRMLDDVAARWLEVEGWLALGAKPRVAVAAIGRSAAAAALVPALDQTRSVGLVVLPGAFVGLLLAGATPIEAGRLQLLVLVGLLAAETVAVSVATTVLAGRLGKQKPQEPS